MSTEQNRGDSFIPIPWSTKGPPEGTPPSIKVLVGRTLRVIEHGHVATQEVVPGRVTIYKTQDGRILSISIEADSECAR